MLSSSGLWSAVLVGAAAGLSIVVRLHMMISKVMRALDRVDDHESRINRLEHHTGIVVEDKRG